MQATIRLDTDSNRSISGQRVRRRATQQNEEAAIRRTLEKIEYLPRFKALICKYHQHAVRTESHKSVLAPSDEQFAEFENYEVVAPQDIDLPEANEPPITQLGQPKLAYACKQRGCGHISINCKVIAEHCNKNHGWRSREQGKKNRPY
jgi:hypothetical protein